MNNRLFFNHTFVLAGMILGASMYAVSSDEQKDAHQVPTVSSWSRMQSAAPKLFGASLVLGGACGAYAYSGALKRYITEQPLDALKNTTYLGVFAWTNWCLLNKTNALKQGRIERHPNERGRLPDNAPEHADCAKAFMFPVFITGASYLSPVFNSMVPDKFVVGIGIGMFALNIAKSAVTICYNNLVDRVDGKFTREVGYLEQSMQMYNNDENEFKQYRKETVDSYVSGHNDWKNQFDKYIEDRQAASQQWVIDERAKLNKLLTSYGNFNASWKPEEHRVSGQYPSFDLPQKAESAV